MPEQVERNTDMGADGGQDDRKRGPAAGTRLGSRSPGWRLVSLVAAAVTWLLALAAPALAHPALVNSSPGAGYSVTEPPVAISLVFNEVVTLPERAMVVRDSAGVAVELRVGTTTGGSTVVGTPVRRLQKGSYDVVYNVVGRDGDLISGTFPFGVATPVAAGATAGAAGGSPGQHVQADKTLLRAGLFLGLALALGGWHLAWRLDLVDREARAVVPLTRAGSALALLAVIGLLVQLGPAADLVATATTPGIGRLLGLQALLLAVAVIFSRRPGRGIVAPPLLLFVVALEAVRAHPGEAGGPLGATLTLVHLLAAVLWLGGLVHVLRLAAGSRPRTAILRAVEVYARVAFVLVVLVALTGTASALVLLPTAADWVGTSYGRVLLAKIAVFGVVVVLAFAGRARLRRRRLREDGQGQRWSVRAPMGRMAVTETALLTAIVVAAAAITTVTPARLVPAASLLAAPVGPTVRMAERPRQVTVAVVASRGRVDAKVSTPNDGTATAVKLTGSVQPPAGGTVPLRLASCGATCWTAPVQWLTGTNILTFDVSAGKYQAGRTAIRISWPVVPVPDLLGRVQDAMGANSAIDTTETVTSGFGPAPSRQSRRSGQEFLSGQPWAEGGATDAALVIDQGRRTLLFALPALGYHFAMVLDGSDRIVSERIVTPNHLLIRQYRYP